MAIGKGGMVGLAFLEDVVVLDVGDEATALASVYLAELGATVVRVEDVEGDGLRRRGGFWHVVHNAGKRSVAVDLTSEQAWAPVEAALAGVDVVIGALEPGAPIRRFLEGVPAVEGGRIGVVDVVFRRDQPHVPVTDLTLGAAGGFTVLNGFPEDPPAQAAGDLAFKQVALATAVAALALVTARRRTGTAGRIVVSAQEAVLVTTFQTSNGNLYHWRGVVPSRHQQIAGGSTVLSGDGLWASFTIHPPNYPRFVEWAEREIGPTILTRPEWADRVYVGRHREELMAVVAKLASVTSRADLIKEGQARGLLVTPVNGVADVGCDHHLLARDFFVDVPQPDGASIRLTGSPFRSDLGRGDRRAAPKLGADQELLDQLAHRPPMESAPVAGVEHRQPLAGIRVVDFTWAIAGSFATRLLADLGADVVKIESENRLDPVRHIGPQPTDEVSLDTNGVFQDCCAGKRAVTINVGTPEGQELVRALVRTADVVTSNYTPDRLDRWGFDRQALAALRPGLIVANLAVMGLSGPDAGWRSYGNGLVAMSGVAAHTGFDGRMPQCLGTMHTDFTVPYFGAMQILAALHHRDRTGEGAYLELSQYESSVRLMDVELASVLNGGEGPGRIANRSAYCSPHGIFPAAGDDRWVAVACRSDAERDRLAAVLGAAPTEENLAEWTRTRSRQEVVDTLRAVGLPVSSVEDLDDHHQDPVTRAAWTTMTLPSGITAEVLQAPVVWDGERLPLRRAPLWMEHTHEVLVDELGLDPGRFAELVDAQVLW
jgi:crotonobetainyl-CoA:carnitine CoA-transferase CaiB-like acyl-CoA transferase